MLSKGTEPGPGLEASLRGCDAFLQPGPFKTWPCVQWSRGAILPVLAGPAAHCGLCTVTLSSGRHSPGERAGRFLPWVRPSVRLSQGTHGSPTIPSPGRPVPLPLRDHKHRLDPWGPEAVGWREPEDTRCSELPHRARLTPLR